MFWVRHDLGATNMSSPTVPHSSDLTAASIHLGLPLGGETERGGEWGAGAAVSGRLLLLLTRPCPWSRLFPSVGPGGQTKAISGALSAWVSNSCPEPTSLLPVR